MRDRVLLRTQQNQRSDDGCSGSVLSPQCAAQFDDNDRSATLTHLFNEHLRKTTCMHLSHCHTFFLSTLACLSSPNSLRGLTSVYTRPCTFSRTHTHACTQGQQRYRGGSLRVPQRHARQSDRDPRQPWTTLQLTRASGTSILWPTDPGCPAYRTTQWRRRRCLRGAILAAPGELRECHCRCSRLPLPPPRGFLRTTTTHGVDLGVSGPSVPRDLESYGYLLGCAKFKISGKVQVRT